MSDHHERSLDLAAARGALPDLYRQVARHHRRVEITDGNAADSCVIIARSELESLERALEILADADAMRRVSDSLTQAAAALPR